MTSEIKTKLILFDIGGVLIEYKDVFKTASSEQGFSIDLINKTFDKYDSEITTGKITPQQLYEICLDENNIQADRSYDFLNSWLKDYVCIKPAFDFVQLLKNQYMVGIFSNIYKGMVPKMIQGGLLPKIGYDYIFESCEMGLQKPDKDAYDFIMNATQLEPDEIFFIDNKVENLLPAIRLGWKTFEFLRENPNASVSKLKEILL